MFRNSGFYFLLLLLLAIVGFWQSYFSILLDDIDSYIHFHAVTMLLWIGMLITQAFLIRYNKRSLHKVVGRLSYFLVPVLIISLVLLSHSQIIIQEYGISYARLYILFLQLSLLTVFVTAYALAIINRRSPAHHARYMICTALTMIDPVVARIPLNLPALPFDYQVLTFGLTDIILIVLIILERNQKRGREVFPVILAMFVFFQWLNLTWTHSEVWDSFALWFANLPLT
ncbi:MAG: hypothetical protein QM504_13460 [Pseudomonadota bacterium]